MDQQPRQSDAIRTRPDARAYSELLAFVSHELQSPIASIVTDLNLLIDGYLGELNDPQREKLQQSIKKGQYLLALVRDYLNLERLEDQALEAQFSAGVDLVGQVIEPAIELLESTIAEKQMSIERRFASSLCPVDCDPALLRIGISNLLSNAVKYGRNEGRIHVGAEVGERLARITVWNEGPGFASSERTKLFRKFVRLSDPALRCAKGTGVGLYSTWRIAHLHGGHVSAHSEQGSWAEFLLAIPIRQRVEDRTE